METAEAWQLSNPPILQLASLRASMEIFDKVGMEAIRKKSVELTKFLESELERGNDGSFTVITPSDPSERGAQLSLLFQGNARNRFEALRKADIICDFREPDVIRVAPAPLYNTFQDVQKFAAAVTASHVDP